MQVAVSAEIARRRVTRPAEDAVDETEYHVVPRAPVDTEVEGLSTQELGRGKRVRHAAQQQFAAQQCAARPRGGLPVALKVGSQAHQSHPAHSYS